MKYLHFMFHDMTLDFHQLIKRGLETNTLTNNEKKQTIS